MKRKEIKNEYGVFTITIFENSKASVSGNVKAAKKAFKEIHRMPPNKYGNFFGREKAGYNACLELIEN